jgi:electron transport complex protein RnfE
MILPSGGFFTLAGWLLLFNWLKQRKERKAKTAALALGGEVA